MMALMLLQKEQVVTIRLLLHEPLPQELKQKIILRNIKITQPIAKNSDKLVAMVDDIL